MVRLDGTRWKLSCAFMLVGLAMAGCGGPKARPVKGKVTFPDGSPLVEARVCFDGTDSHVSANGNTSADGSYSLTMLKPDDGVLPGSYRVLILPPPPKLATKLDANGETVYLPAQAPPQPVVDPKYEKYETSGLTFKVEDKAENHFDIVVQKPAKTAPVQFMPPGNRD